jgi:plastocyanin
MNHRSHIISLIFLLCLAPPALCGEIEGRVDGWPQATLTAAHHGVVWLVGPPGPVDVKSRSGTKPTMSQIKGQFSPSFLVVVAGETVAMPNKDDVAHNVYSNSSSRKFNLGFYEKGDDREVTFATPGVVEIGCSIHQSMRAIIVVVPNRYYAAIREDGMFRLSNVPKGIYTLKLWGDHVSAQSRDITVPAVGKVEVTLDGRTSQQLDHVGKPMREN